MREPCPKRPRSRPERRALPTSGPGATRRVRSIVGACAVGLVAVVMLAGITGAEVTRQPSAHSGEDVLLLASTVDGGGALAINYDFSGPVLLTLDVIAGDLARFSAIDPFFQIQEADDPTGSLYRIDDGVEVTFELVAIDPAVAVRLKGVNLLEAGDSVAIGTMPGLHADPQWQLTVPVGDVGCHQVTFRLVTSASSYASSEPYTLTLTNDPQRACDGTPVCGDADGNGVHSVADGVNVLRAAAELSSSCVPAVCDVDGNGAVSVADGVNVLRAAAGLSATLTCAEL